MPPVDPSRDNEQPRALIVTIYGLYGRESDGWLPVAGLIRLLAELDVDEPAVRSAISRLKRRGLLEAHRRNGVAGYALSAGAAAILEEGDARIFAPPTPRLADGWLLAVFSVPETERARRHTLRSQLVALGFGSAAPGVWVAPAHRFALTAATLERHGLAEYVDLFRAEYLAFGDIGKHARDWWDLDEIGADYQAFIDAYAPVLPAAPARAFGTWVRALTAWRRLPYRDPGLPVELLPADWPGGNARALLAELRSALVEPAGDAVLRLLGPHPADLTG
jgi:phenylacetic acid degradation operon negative regulatory protein